MTAVLKLEPVFLFPFSNMLKLSFVGAGKRLPSVNLYSCTLFKFSIIFSAGMLSTGYVVIHCSICGYQESCRLGTPNEIWYEEACAEYTM